MKIDDQQGHGHQGPLATGEQREPLDLLARRPRLDVEPGGEHVVRVGEDQPTLAAGEQPAEDPLELDRDIVVGLGEDPLDPLVDLADDVEQVALDRLRSSSWVGEERVPLLQRGELLQRQRVDPPERREPPLAAAQPLLLGLAHVGLGLAGSSLPSARVGWGTSWCGPNSSTSVGGVDAELLDGARLELLDAQPLLGPRHLVAVHGVGQLAQLVLEDGDVAPQHAELGVARRSRASSARRRRARPARRRG